MKLGKVSVVISSHNEGDNVVDMIDCIVKNTSYPYYEVIVVDDGSTDGSCERVDMNNNKKEYVSVIKASNLGVAGARNLGAQMSTGEVLIFMDAHCYTPAGWMTSLIEILQEPQVGIAGPAIADLNYNKSALGLGAVWRDAGLEIKWLPQKDTTPYPVPLVMGACQAMRRTVFEKVGTYDSGMTHWGDEDRELSFRTWLMGYDVIVHPQVVIHHLFRDKLPYPADGFKILYNKLRMAMLHFNQKRVARVFEYYQNVPGFSTIMLWLLESDVMARRRQLEKIRIRSDDWFFSHFDCEIHIPEWLTTGRKRVNSM